MNRRMIALLVAAAIASAMAAVVLATASARPTASVVPAVDAQERIAMGSSSYWRDKLVGCTNGVMTDEALYTPAAQDCLLDVMNAAVTAGHMLTVQKAMEEQISETPALFDACHDVGHKAGRLAFERTRNASQLLRENRSDTCLYAFGHGILDGFAASAPTAEQFQQVADTCIDLLKDSSNKATLCADGLGHVAWSSTNDIREAVHRCELLSTPTGRSACGEGVIMQVFEPAGFLPSEDIAEAPEELPGMCDSWDTDDADLRAGCNSGAGYIYTRPAWRLQVNWRGQHAPGVPLDEATSEQMYQAMADATRMCKSHRSEEAVNECMKSLSGQVPHLVYDLPDLLDRICSLQGEWKERCRTWRHVLS